MTPGGQRRVLAAGVPDETATDALTDALTDGHVVDRTATWAATEPQLGDAACVVLGPGLPDADTLDAARAVAAATPPPPAVVYDDAVTTADALAAGAADHAPPDAGVDALVARVHRAIDDAATRRTLRRERSILDSLLTHIPVSVYFKDTRGRHVRVSDSVVGGPGEHIVNEEGKTHPAREDVLGKTDFDLYHADGAETSRETETRILETGDPADEVLQEYPPVEPHDWRVYTRTAKAPWYDHDGRLAGIVGVTRDVTQRKTYEHRLERQNERLDQFASAVSHDLRNPLNVAIGNLDLVTADVDHPRIPELRNALDRMDALIEDVLALAKHGKSVEDRDPVDVTDAARAAWRTVDTADATLTVATDAAIYADPDRLHRLLENLFRNSVEHAAPTVSVTVDVDGYVLTVEDDGPGIPPEHRDTVFDRGFTTNETGTGFGLQVVDQIASAHDWTAAVTEAENGGARFELRGVRPATN